MTPKVDYTDKIPLRLSRCNVQCGLMGEAVIAPIMQSYKNKLKAGWEDE